MFGKSGQIYGQSISRDSETIKRARIRLSFGLLATLFAYGLHGDPMHQGTCHEYSPASLTFELGSAPALAVASGHKWIAGRFLATLLK